MPSWLAPLDYRVFMRTGFRDNFHYPGAPLSSFRPSSESSGYRAAASSRPAEALRVLSTSFPEVSSPSAYSRTGQRLVEGQVFLPDHLASSGFLNPLTLLSAPCLPALFHAGSALGVFPCRAFPFRAAVRRLRRRCPLVVGPPLLTSPSRHRLTQAPHSAVPDSPFRTAPTFRALLHTKVRLSSPAV